MPVSQLERYAFSPHVAARRGSMKIAALVSLVVLSALIGSVSVWKGGRQRNGLNGQTLTVYCASGVMPAVSEIAEQYEREFGIHIELHPGSSGVLEQQLKQSAKGDLYIPAGREPFLTRGRDEGYVHEILPLAQFRLVLAVAPGNPSHIESLDDLLRDDVDTAIANEHAAVGKVTRQVLSTWSGWEALEKRATSKPTVTEVATDVQLGVRVNAGLIWDANAKQLGLEIVDVPEIRDHADGTATIAAGVLSYCLQPAEALRFARYLSAPEKGQVTFQRHDYESVAGDPWSRVPRLVLFSGGVNRVAIETTIAEFQQREGCEVITSFQGCGALVTTIKAGEKPDAFFACDASFVPPVADEYPDPITISRTEMVMLVKAGNPRGIGTLADLGQPGVTVGIADEQLTALGSLTMTLLREVGVYDAVVANRRATTPTADLLVTQLLTVDKLDAVIVYRANCNAIGDQGEIIPIEHASARAIQPFVIHRQTEYPQLTQRLLEALTTSKSRDRFLENGFSWERE